MSIVERAKNIIFKPADEWNVIAAEPATIGRLFTGYAMPLALIQWSPQYCLQDYWVFLPQT